MALIPRYLIQKTLANLVLITVTLGGLQWIVGASRALLKNPEQWLASMQGALLPIVPQWIHLFPFSCALAVALSIYQLQRHRELTAMYALGLTRGRLIATWMTALFTLSALAILADNWLGPAAGSTWSQQRSHVTDFHILHNLRLKQQQRFIQVDRLSADGRLHNVLIFEPRPAELRVIHAQKGRIMGHQWLLEQAEIRLLPQGDRTLHQTLMLDPIVDVATLNTLKTEPYFSGVMQLWKQFWYRRAHQLDRGLWGDTLWYKLLTPVNTMLLSLAMMIPLSRLDERNRDAKPLFKAIALGLLFILVRQFLLRAGADAELGDPLRPMMPGWVCLAVAYFWMRARSPRPAS